MLLPFLSISSQSLNLTSIETTLPFKVIPSSPKIEVQGRGLLAQTEEPPKRSLSGISFSAHTMIKIINGFGMVWVLGFLFLLVRFLFGVASLRKFKDDLVEIHSGRTTKILEATEKPFGRRVRAKVFTSRKIQSVFAMGLFKPLIIIPQDLFIKLSDSEIKGILLHELSHIFHRDQMTGILQRIVTALNWWNPLVYALSSDFSRTREEISDNYVLLENNSKEYAECLINLAEKTSLISRVPVFTAMASPHIPLKERVKHILSKERIMETKLKKSTILVIVMISIFLISGIAGYRLTFASAENENLPEAAAKEMPIPQEKKKDTDKQKSLGKKIVPPKLIKKVHPIYPEIARQAKVEGVVILEVTTDIYGRVQSVKVLRSIPLLDKAAVDAVKQWVYEPMVINSKPRGVIFTVTCTFRLDEKDKSSK
jgi:TonB family protein